MPVAERDVGLLAMAIPLRPGERRGMPIEWVRQRRAHVLIGAAGILPITEQRRLRRLAHLVHLRRSNEHARREFAVAVTDVAGVVVVACVRIGGGHRATGVA